MLSTTKAVNGVRRVSEILQVCEKELFSLIENRCIWKSSETSRIFQRFALKSAKKSIHDDTGIMQKRKKTELNWNMQSFEFSA